MNQPVPDSTRLRARWRDGEAAIGAWSVSADPLVAELVAATEADVVCVDAQHGYSDTATLPGLLASMRVVGRVPLVRVRWNEPGQIMRALDAGACGVVVPMVNNGAEALAAAQACRFPPNGIRSWGPLWSARPILPPEQADAETMCVVMIETAQAVANLAEILATPGVDAVYIGPNDLALSSGFGRQTYRNSEAVDDLLTSVLTAAKAAGMPVGMHCSDAAMAHHWRDRGASWLTALTDMDVLASGLQTAVEAAQQR
ncbi:aldolase/citrate lyase family protein [Propionicimonas sp.]|uniref:HpcH/HpaI aldolase family protein n=1 Tax=Propionicimonas sp. TaxID=1955623 RepID=UPI00184A30CE|nr:aldolase/citrate lyase family protein [Propionicimonas sp.]MBU3977902.1 aldolase [Actinomycetota bacterium]MBA3021875.1 aldolase [Propionicimonas sp.]MBU3985346.1 aldolase [Actinomycetota bacterium]MBU4007401.1 aldolase [Actinomycetota bacterium]MBU4065653.1 aldolase [Actinomycetota bacterium]